MVVRCGGCLLAFGPPAWHCLQRDVGLVFVHIGGITWRNMLGRPAMLLFR